MSVTREPNSLLTERSVEAILRNQRANGAIVASPDFGQYQFCWLRDGSFNSFALDRAGKHDASRRYHLWVNAAVAGIAGVIDDVIEKHRRGDVISPLDMPPARFALDGTTVVDDWPNFQIDGYGTWLWSLGQHLAMSGITEVPDEFLDSVRRVAKYLTAFALSTCYDVWEENGDALHTSTLACVYGGLSAAGHFLGNEDITATAAAVRAHVLDAAAKSGYFVKSSTNDDVDASALWLSAPFGVVEPNDDCFAKTVSMIEDRLTFDGGIRRYPTDVYFGSGAWPVLTGSLGWHYVDLGDFDGARRCLTWIEHHFDEEGRLGEQYGGEARDPAHYYEWVERWGLPAKDLMWSHAMYVVLSLAINEASPTEESRMAYGGRGMNEGG
jgi:GH15 family glucan-1,4-alpha-glucosidase